MKILFLTPRVPYPLDVGTSLRNFRLIQSAAREHEVHLLSFIDRPLRVEHVETLEQVCRRVELRPAPPHDTIARLTGLVRSPLPDMAFRRWSPAFARSLLSLLAEERYDLVQAEGIEMARYLPLCRGARRIFSDHNVEHQLQARAYLIDRAHPSRWPQAAYSKVQAQRLARFEAAACRLADAVLAVSDEDAAALQALEPSGRYRVVPNAIATDAYPARPLRCPSPPVRPTMGPLDPHGPLSLTQHGVAYHGAPPLRGIPTAPPFGPPRVKGRGGAGEQRREPCSPALLFAGTLDYRPNADAVRWLLDAIMPIVWDGVPNARVFVVGRGPAPDIVARGQHDPRIAVTGPVDSMDPYWTRASLYVLPLRGGGGTRFKALEAMAAGLPLVSTRMGMEGIAAEDGTHYLSGETPAELAAAIGRLLEDPALRDQLAEAGTRLVRERYDWRVVAARLLDVYREVA